MKNIFKNLHGLPSMLEHLRHPGNCSQESNHHFKIKSGIVMKFEIRSKIELFCYDPQVGVGGLELSKYLYIFFFFQKWILLVRGPS